MEIGKRIDGVSTTMEGLKSRMNCMDSKMDGIYNDLDGKINSLASHMKTIDLKVAQASSSSKNQSATLPSKTETRPNEYCNVLLTSDKSDHERDVEELSKLLYGMNGVDLVSKSEARVQVCSKKEVKAHMVEKKEATNVDMSPYEPPLPFPGRFYTKAPKKVLSSFKSSMNEIGVPLPSMDNLYQVPTHKKFIQSILDNRAKVEEIMSLYESPSEPLSPKTLPKLKNPGTFTISCSLGDLTVENVLCDSGASVNVMSFDMMKSIGINEMKQHSASITYGDASSKSTLGMLEDYPLIVGDCLVDNIAFWHIFYYDFITTWHRF
ncbi:hypothetical protein V5N11_029510 [Cardamine amara subsp. amara]|uniref:Aspartic peptidase DDI1-type domain-containing protein n=1 Tax=Cardamine amara subsp. amara TaxID=228776 RepID=A0ABD1BN66_CARAN